MWNRIYMSRCCQSQRQNVIKWNPCILNKAMCSCVHGAEKKKKKLSPEYISSLCHDAICAMCDPKPTQSEQVLFFLFVSCCVSFVVVNTRIVCGNGVHLLVAKGSRTHHWEHSTALCRMRNRQLMGRGERGEKIVEKQEWKCSITNVHVNK